MGRRAIWLLLLLGSTPVAADPLATTNPSASAADVPAIPAEVVAPVPVAAPMPIPDQLAAAPPADRASGVIVEPPHPSHRVANALLAVPRTIALFLLEGPRYAAVRLDRKRESQSPSYGGRDVTKQGGWRFGAVVDWETELGASIGVRVGHGFGEASVDAHGGLFGPRGQSGGLRATLGRFTEADVEPVLTLDVGRSLTRAFAGIGDAPPIPFDPYRSGPRATYDTRMFETSAGLVARTSGVKIEARAIADVLRSDDGDATFTGSYDGMALVGFDETQRAGTGEVAVSYDTRRTSYRFNKRGAPSTGLYLRGAYGYTAGTASRTGDFATSRGTIEARRLFDLFHGDRVLTIGASLEAVTASATELPFDRLPGLGGSERMRAFARDELRDRTATHADVEYSWPLDSRSSGFLFVETGAVHPGVSELAASRFHAGYGGGIRFVGAAGAWARIQIAGSGSGDVGGFITLGAL
ncbi:MAG: hypothetical protein H0T89_05780 [Deltaproteobacteria bacterium]|nr:hypothetical protein [Deltaproteobacteria bacterium]MDQ3298143.1 hypothetical protein [Myxococcota bacterium]